MLDPVVIQNTSYDLVIIGGGINGAGVAREAALRGLKTLLLEKSDFGSGTTHASSRLIHGGLRYLESFEWDLVRESLREREILLRTAPHLVQPLLLTIPLYRHTTRPKWQIQVGMALYDGLSFDKSLPSHRILSAESVQRLFPGIQSQALTGAAQYYDAQATYAERLCWETLLDAQQAGATLLNYVRVTDIEVQQQRIIALTVQDERPPAEKSLSPWRIPVGPQTVVVNTSGPWVDQVLGLLPSQPVSPLIGGTQGTHLIVDRFPAMPDTGLYVEAESDHRPLFILPWADQVLIGTTDMPYGGDLDAVHATPPEIDYLLAETNRILPTAGLTWQDIRFTYAGIRPLPLAVGKTAGQITRRHLLIDHTQAGIPNLISLVGGKLTTFRQVGEECVDQVYGKLQRPAPASVTATRMFPGAVGWLDPGFQETLSGYRHRFSRETLDHLAHLYGTRALDVLALTDQAPDLADPVVSDLPDIQAQIVYAVRAERALTVTDILLRRTVMGMQHRASDDLLSKLASVLSRYAGWDPVKTAQP